MSDDEPERPSRPVTSMSLRAERLRLQLLRASGAKLDPDRDPGLSAPPAPRDPELVNRFAIAGFIVGIVAVFFDTVFVPSAVALVLCFVGLRRARQLDARGKGPFGRRRALWGIGLALFGAAGVAFSLWIRPLL